MLIVNGWNKDNSFKCTRACHFNGDSLQIKSTRVSLIEIRYFLKEVFPNGNFIRLSWPQHSALACSSCSTRPLAHPSRSARPSLRSASPEKTLPNLWEVAAWEITTWEIVTWEVTFGKIYNIFFQIGLVNPAFWNTGSFTSHWYN